MLDEKEMKQADINLNIKKYEIDINQNNSKSYLIYDYPGVLAPGFLYGLQHGMFVGEQKNGRTDISISIIVKPAELNFDKGRKMQMDRLQQEINSSNTNKASDFADPQKIAALETLQNLRSGRSNFVELYFAVTLISSEAKTLKNSCKGFERSLLSLGNSDQFKFTEMMYEQYLGLQSTSIVGSSEKLLKEHKGRLMGVDSLAAFYPYVSGNFSDPNGIYIGHRIASALSLNLNFKKSADAQNMLVTGATGEGKSAFIKGLILGLLASKYRVYVYDLDGEYNDICNAYGGIPIDLTGEDAPFVDPTIIQSKLIDDVEDLNKLTKDDIEKIKKEDSKRYDDAAEETIALISMICGEKKWNQDETIENAAQLSLIEMWRDEGITDNHNTWDNGSPTLHKLYKKIKENSSNKNFLFYEGVKKLFNHLWPFFEGLDKRTFSNSIDSEVFQKNKLVVIRMISAGENPSPKKKRSATLKFNMASNMVWNQIKKDRLLKNQVSAEILDEFQRAGNDESVYRAVYRGITTSRKFNSMVILGFNDPSILFAERTDSEGNKISNKGLWTNTRHLVAFRLPKDTVDKIAKDSEMPSEAISLWRTLPKYAFLFRTMLDNNQQAYEILKMKLPKEELELSKTREFV